MNVVRDSFSDEDDGGDHSALLEGQDSQYRGTEEEQCAKDDDFCLAGIPWLPKEIGAPLAETKHMQNILNVFPEDDPRRKRRKDLYEAIVETFSAFLPARYHSMDSLALHKSSNDGKYWANSTAFLLNSHACGCKFLVDLNTNLQNEQELTHNILDTSIYKRARNSLIKGNEAEECKSAAEFLLEPWVLLQVPFQPLLMLQWATGALAEGLKFQREIVDLCMFYPRKMRNLIDKLFKMLSNVVATVTSFQSIVYDGCFLGQIKSFWNSEIASHFAKSIDALKFILSDKCGMVVKSLKRMAWNETNCKRNNKSEQLETYKNLVDLGTVPNYFNYHGFWRQKSVIKNLYDSSKIAYMPSIVQLCTKRNKISESVELPATKDKDVVNFAREKLLQTGKIQGLNKDKIITTEVLKNLSLFHNSYKSYQAYTETCRKLKGAGIIYDSTALHSDVVLAEVEAEMVWFILPAIEKSQLFISAANCEGPELSLSQITSLLSGVFSKTSCSFYKQLDQVSASFKPEHAEFPDHDQGAEKIAAHLQERIKRLVLSMIKRQLKNLKETSLNFYPECQFVQMVLPCFVASILDMDKDLSVSKDTKRKFTNFVHELVKSYENYEFCQNLTFYEDKTPFTLYVRHTLEYVTWNMFRDLENAFRNNFGDCMAINAIFTMGPSSKLCEIMLNNENNYDDLMYWSFQMFMLANRMRDALLSCFDCNICGYDFELNFILQSITLFVDLEQEDRQICDIYSKRIKTRVRTKIDIVEIDATLHKLSEKAKEMSEMNMSGLFSISWSNILTLKS